MNKINFQNLPSQTTPVNATNLNQLQTNVDNGKVETEVNAVSNIDANDCLKSGFYYLSSGCSNVPESYFRLIVNGSSTSADVFQLGYGMATGAMYTRRKSTNTWQGWKEVLHQQTGTWTPTITTLEGAVPTMTYTTRRGSYKKIGNMVFISFCVRGKITALTGTNNYGIILGLPFTVKEISLGENTIGIGMLYHLIQSTTDVNLLPYPNASYLRIQNEYGNSAAKLMVTDTDYFILAGSGWYEIA